MSTVTLSQPQREYISAEKALGMASHPFTTALPAFQASLTLFATAFSSFAIWEGTLGGGREGVNAAKTENPWLSLA